MKFHAIGDSSTPKPCQSKRDQKGLQLAEASVRETTSTRILFMKQIETGLTCFGKSQLAAPPVDRSSSHDPATRGRTMAAQQQLPLGFGWET